MALSLPLSKIIDVDSKIPKVIAQYDKFTREKIQFPLSDEIGNARYDDSIYRDFTHPNNNIDSWPENSEIHKALAPTRFHIFDKYLRYPKYIKGPGQRDLIDEVFMAIVEAMEEVDPQSRNLSSTEIIHNFIAAIDRRMANK